MKGANLSFYEIPPPAQRQAGKLRVQTKESEILQGIGKPLPKRIFPNKKRATKWLRVNISKRYNKKKRNQIGYADKYLKYLIIARISIVTNTALS